MMAGFLEDTPAARRERDREIVVRLIFVVYWLLIFEGALRKWVFPDLSDYIFFDRDPFVLAIYFLAFRSRLFARSILLYWGLGIGLLVIPVMMFHLIADDLNPVVLAYGWRNYFYFMPLAFVMWEVLGADDLRRLIRQNAWVALPMAVLVYIQYVSPVDAYVNRSLGTGGYIFQIIAGVVRTTGTFTFTAGFSLYAASLFAMLLAAWLRSDIAQALGPRLRAAASFATLAMVALAGSRTVIALVLLILIAAVAAPLLVRGGAQRVRMLLIPLSLGLVGVVLAATLFAGALNNLSVRETSAVDSEGSTVGRAFSSLYMFTDYIDETPLLGYGIGFGTNGGVAADNGSITGFRLAEDEWSRIYLELGPLYALAYVALRLALVLTLVRGAVRVATRTGDPLPLLLLGFIGTVLVNGQMTLQGTINGYGWVFLGLTLAAIRAGEPAPRAP
jgi:hypothetical protein